MILNSNMINSSQKINPFKLIIIGDSGVGKTNIINKYCKNDFSEQTKPTIGVEFYSKNLIINQKDPEKAKIKICLQIWDTAGQERFRGIASSYYRRALGVILVYDIFNKKSFLNLEKWLEEIYLYSIKDVEIVLLGNKLDLVKLR